MTSRRHPFAYSQHVRYSQSTDTFASWLRLTPEPNIPLVPPLSSKPPAPTALHRSLSQQPQPRQYQETDYRETLPTVDVDVPTVSSKSSPGHLVKHSSWVTLLLSGQEEGASEAIYSNGATIEGILAVPRPAGLLALQIKVRNTFTHLIVFFDADSV